MIWVLYIKYALCLDESIQGLNRVAFKVTNEKGRNQDQMSSAMNNLQRLRGLDARSKYIHTSTLHMYSKYYKPQGLVCLMHAVSQGAPHPKPRLRVSSKNPSQETIDADYTAVARLLA